MESNTKTSHHRKGSVKCGLKNKIHIPKGAHSRKTHVPVPFHNELQKVFAEIQERASPDMVGKEQTIPKFKQRGVGTLVKKFDKDKTPPFKQTVPKMYIPETNKEIKQLIKGISENNSSSCDNTTQEPVIKSKQLPMKPKLEPKPFISVKPKTQSPLISQFSNNSENKKYNKAPSAPKKTQCNSGISSEKKQNDTSINVTVNVLKSSNSSLSSKSQHEDKNNNQNNKKDSQVISNKVSNDSKNKTITPPATTRGTGHKNQTKSDGGFNKAPLKPRKDVAGSPFRVPELCSNDKPPALPPRKGSADIASSVSELKGRLNNAISSPPGIVQDNPPRKPPRLFTSNEPNGFQKTKEKTNKSSDVSENSCNTQVSDSEWSDEETEKRKKHPISNSRYGSSSKQRHHNTEPKKKWSKKSQIVRSKQENVPENETVVSCDYEDVEFKPNKGDSDWETDEEFYPVDSGGYEIVEKAGWGPGRLRMRKFRISTNNNEPTSTTILRPSSRNSSSGSDRASSRRSSYYSDKDSVELVQNPDTEKCTKNNERNSVNRNSNFKEKDLNSLPLPPRQRKTVEQRICTKKTKSDNPYLKEVPLPPPDNDESTTTHCNTLPIPSSKLSSVLPDKPLLPPKSSSQKPKHFVSPLVDPNTPVPVLRKKKQESKEVSLAVLRLSSSIGEENYNTRQPTIKCEDTSSNNQNEDPPPLLPRTYPKSPKSSRTKQSRKTSATNNIPIIQTNVPDDDIPNIMAPPVPYRTERRGSGNVTVPSVPKALPEEVLSKPVGFSQQKKDGTLTVSIPAPRRTSTDDKYLKPGTAHNNGYLPMDQQKGKSNYIDPHTELESVPSPLPKMPSSCMHLLDVPLSSVSPGTTAHDYLKLLNDEDDPASETNSMILEDEEPVYMFGEEPLYQIYHCGAVFRDVFQNDGQVTDDDSYGAIYESSENVRDYVKDILNRANSADAVRSAGSTKSDTPCSLETIVETGAGTRTLWAETKKVQDSGLLETLSDAEKKIQEGIFEIITSEASYLKSLDLLLNHFLAAPEFNIKKPKDMCITKREHQVLFSNIRSVRETSKKFILVLEDIWKKSCHLNPGEVCKAINDAIPQGFEVYVKYCVNQTYQDRMLRYLRKTNNQFPQALQRLEKKRECHGLTMQSFLTLPMQRVTRLPLLVDAVCHRIDCNSPEYEIVTQCLSALQKLVKRCNEGAKIMDNIEQVNTIDRMLEFKNIKKIPIVSQSRNLIKKGSLIHLIHSSSGLFKKKKENLFLFLFNDLLIITKRKSDDCYQVQDYAPRINVHADTLTEEQVQKQYPSAPSGYKHLFLMVLLEKQTEFIFSCDTTSDCTRWVEAINPAQSQNADERIYEAWDCPQVQVIHKYIAQEPDEMSLEESDVVNVFKKMADGWYEGERIRDGTRGWFPSNHAIEIQSQHVRAKNLKQRYRMLQMSHSQLASMFENPKLAWEKIDAS